MRTFLRVAAACFTFIALAAHGSIVRTDGRDLRGRWIPSTDGKTYLVVDNDNGGKCAVITVDGLVWPYPVQARGPIEPGEHLIECGNSGGTTFVIPDGVIYYFDYWGP